MSTESTTNPDRVSCSGRLLLIAILSVIALCVLGLVSDFMSTPGIDAETKGYLEGQIEEVSGIGDATDPCWVGSQQLGSTDVPQHFSNGPDWRRESNLDTWIFRPGFVLRPDRESNCGAESWGYVESSSPLPFFVRTHFGYFSDRASANAPGDDGATPSQMANEGVRTYFTLFGKSVLLNEWSIREQPE